jgi:glycerophosphoryl diester phosphodiesterase
VAAGADGLEFDVHLSSDGVVVVCHDETVERTTDSSGYVRAHTAAELARIDAGCRFVDGHGSYPFRRCGIGIPTLREVLGRYPSLLMIVEMKVNSEAMGRAVAEEVRAAAARDRVCVAGYGRRAMDAARAALPGMPTSACHPEVRMAVYRSIARWPVRHPPYQMYQVPERAGAIHVVTPRFVRHAHDAGLHVHVWTVDDEPAMRRLLGWGVDGLISNRPDVAVRVLDAYQPPARTSS